jgi:putative ABC transport system permease protein
MLFKIAWRNIWRNRTRSLVVIASVAVGLFAGMFMMAFFEGMAKQDVENTVETQLSHIQFHNPSFPADKAANYIIQNGPALIAKLKKDINIKAVSGRLVTTGMISSSSTALGVEIHSVVPSDEKAVSSIWKDIIQGAYFSGLKKNEIVIGQKLAEKLGIKLHNKIVLTFQSTTGDLTAGSFRIAGIFRSPNSAFDESTVFTQADDLAALLGTGNGIHEIAIILKDDQQVDTAAGVFKKEYPSLLVQTYKELSPEIAMITGVVDQAMYIIIGIILLALMFGIINTMLMAVLERQREFGVLMAIGMNKPRVFFMILLESVMLTCAGIPAGILLAVVTVGMLARHGIDLSAFSQALSQYGFSSIIYPDLKQSMFLPIILMTAFTAVLSAIYPAIKALRFKPAEAIHKI